MAQCRPSRGVIAQGVSSRVRVPIDTHTRAALRETARDARHRSRRNLAQLTLRCVLIPPGGAVSGLRPPRRRRRAPRWHRGVGDKLPVHGHCGRTAAVEVHGRPAAGESCWACRWWRLTLTGCCRRPSHVRHLRTRCGSCRSVTTSRRGTSWRVQAAVRDGRAVTPDSAAPAAVEHATYVMTLDMYQRPRRPCLWYPRKRTARVLLVVYVVLLIGFTAYGVAAGCTPAISRGLTVPAGRGDTHARRDGAGYCLHVRVVRGKLAGDRVDPIAALCGSSPRTWCVKRSPRDPVVGLWAVSAAAVSGLALTSFAAAVGSSVVPAGVMRLRARTSRPK